MWLFTHDTGVCPCSDIDFKIIIDDNQIKSIPEIKQINFDLFLRIYLVVYLRYSTEKKKM